MAVFCGCCLSGVSVAWLCVSGGLHIADDVGWMVLWIQVLAVMCERRLAHCGVDGACGWCRVCENGRFRGCCTLGVSVTWLCVSGGWRLSAVGLRWRGLQSA